MGYIYTYKYVSYIINNQFLDLVVKSQGYSDLILMTLFQS